LHREFYAAILGKQKEEYFARDDNSQIDPFSFVASRSLRGESVCHQYNCRLEKLDFLGHFAALYANKVILPRPLMASERVCSVTEAATQISHSSLAFLRLRPLIDAGVVYPVVMRSFGCVHTAQWVDQMTCLGPPHGG
jgi:hypothetical protein